MSLPTRQATAEIPWVLIIAMRNRLVHGYSSVDREIVWKAAIVEIPELLPKLRTLVGAN